MNVLFYALECKKSIHSINTFSITNPKISEKSELNISEQIAMGYKRLKDQINQLPSTSSKSFMPEFTVLRPDLDTLK
jgi:hypothetical protein